MFHVDLHVCMFKHSLNNLQNVLLNQSYMRKGFVEIWEVPRYVVVINHLHHPVDMFDNVYTTVDMP